MFKEEGQKRKYQYNESKGSSTTNAESESKRYMLALLYQGGQGPRLSKSLKRNIAR